MKRKVDAFDHEMTFKYSTVSGLSSSVPPQETRNLSLYIIRADCAPALARSNSLTVAPHATVTVRWAIRVGRTQRTVVTALFRFHLNGYHSVKDLVSDLLFLLHVVGAIILFGLWAEGNAAGGCGDGDASTRKALPSNLLFRTVNLLLSIVTLDESVKGTGNALAVFVEALAKRVLEVEVESNQMSEGLRILFVHTEVSTIVRDVVFVEMTFSVVEALLFGVDTGLALALMLAHTFELVRESGEGLGHSGFQLGVLEAILQPRTDCGVGCHVPLNSDVEASLPGNTTRTYSRELHIRAVTV